MSSLNGMHSNLRFEVAYLRRCLAGMQEIAKELKIVDSREAFSGEIAEVYHRLCDGMSALDLLLYDLELSLDEEDD